MIRDLIPCADAEELPQESGWAEWDEVVAELDAKENPDA